MTAVCERKKRKRTSEYPESITSGTGAVEEFKCKNHYGIGSQNG